jgi:hypothetical protein
MNTPITDFPYFAPDPDEFETAMWQSNLDMVKGMCAEYPARVNALAFIFACRNSSLKVVAYLWGLVGPSLTQEDLKHASSTPHAANMKFLIEHGLSVRDLNHDSMIFNVLLLDKCDMFEVLASNDGSFVEIACKNYPHLIKGNVKKLLDSGAYLGL